MPKNHLNTCNCTDKGNSSTESKPTMFNNLKQNVIRYNLYDPYDSNIYVN